MKRDQSREAEPAESVLATRIATLEIVGRAADIDLLQGMMDHVARERAACVFITGEGGIGKSRLVATAIAHARRRRWTVASGRAYAVESGAPYGVLADALLPLIQSVDRSALSTLTRGAGDQLALLFPALSDGAPPRVATGEDPGALKARLFSVVTQFLSRHAERTPILLVLEDVQWADPSSLELLHVIVRGLGAAHVLVVVSYADPPHDASATARQVERSLANDGLARSLRLAPLSSDETAALVSGVTATSLDAVRTFAARLHEWTGGNPLFVGETLKALVARGELRSRGSVWSGWETTEFALPPTIRDALAQRVGTLSDTARSVVETAAVLGSRFGYDTLRAVTRIEPLELTAALEELRRVGVLAESSTQDAITYEFAHPLLREAQYAEIGLARRRALHGMVAKALERHYGRDVSEHVDELAMHVSRADESATGPAAVGHLLAAGRRALAQLAAPEAERYLNAALDLVDRDIVAVDSSVREALVDDLARAVHQLGDYARSRRLWERSVAGAERERDHRRLATSRRYLALACQGLGDSEQALGHAEQAVAAAAFAKHELLFARAQITYALLLQELGRSEEAQRALQVALQAAEESQQPVVLALAHAALLQSYLWAGSSRLARQHAERALASMSPAQPATADWTARWMFPLDLRRIRWSVHWATELLDVLTGAGSLDASTPLESARLARDLRSLVLGAWSAEVDLLRTISLARWDSALGIAASSIDLARALGQITLLPRLLVWCACLHIERGDIDAGRVLLEEAWELAGAPAPHARREVVPYTGMMILHRAAGDVDAAIRVGEAGLTLADQRVNAVWAMYRLLPLLSDTHVRAGNLARGIEVTERLARDAARWEHPLAAAWAEAAEGHIAETKGDLRAAVSRLESAASRLESLYAPDAARAYVDVARHRLAAEDRAGAVKALQAAFPVLHSMRDTTALATLRRLFESAGAKMPRPPGGRRAPALHGLSPREREIAGLVMQRKSNKEIARLLDRSPHTVRTQLGQIFKKLSISSRGELADWWRRASVS
jgi:DNA-binding CsgD family transcriptional regulator